MITDKLFFPSLQTEVTNNWQIFPTTSAPPPQASNKLLNHLQQQAQLLVACSTSLSDELSSSNPHFALLAAKLTVQCTQSQAHDTRLTESLLRTLITPIDCEDFKRLSRVINKLTATQLRLAQTLALSTSSAASCGPLQETIVDFADSLNQAIRVLNSDQLIPKCSLLHTNWTRARRALRRLHTSLWASEHELRYTLGKQLLYSEFTAEVRYIKAAYVALMRSRLKNG